MPRTPIGNFIPLVLLRQGYDGVPDSAFSSRKGRCQGDRRRPAAWASSAAPLLTVVPGAFDPRAYPVTALGGGEETRSGEQRQVVTRPFAGEHRYGPN